MSGEAYIMAGGLPGQKFKLVQFHLHWGSDLWHGSEHTYNDMAFPAEVCDLFVPLFGKGHFINDLAHFVVSVYSNILSLTQLHIQFVICFNLIIQIMFGSMAY